ncbi:MAG: hypothetical protein R3A48_29605, partial [Polyangiales bacterium]
GEAALGDQGFGGDNARTSIFDYGRCPELAKWFNEGACDGGGLAPAQRALRAWYQRLLALTRDPVFQHGDTWPLNARNLDNIAFGRLGGEGASGHWLYAFARTFEGRVYVVAANFHPAETLRGARVLLGDEVQARLQGAGASLAWRATERLADTRGATEHISHADLLERGLPLPALAPLSAVFIELERG